MTDEQNNILHNKADEFENIIKEILSDKDFDDFSFEFFRFVTDFCLEHRETLEGTKKL